MRDRDRAQAELLDAYWHSLAHDAPPVPPSALDPAIARAARALAASPLTHDPDPVFLARLGDRLATDGGSPVPRRGLGVFVTSARRHHWAMVLAGVFAAVFLLVIGSVLRSTLGKPQAVSAATILEKASMTAANPATTGIGSFHYTTRVTNRITIPGAVQTHLSASEGEFWGVLPDRWQSVSTSLAPSGGIEGVYKSGSDGTTEWAYNTFGLSSAPTVPGGTHPEARIGMLPPGTTIPLNTPITQLSDTTRPDTPVSLDRDTCYRPKLTGEDTMLGRPTYVIDLGPDLCSRGRFISRSTVTPFPTVSPAQQGPNLMWIDKQTSLCLKQMSEYQDGTMKTQYEVTAIELNIAIPASVFTFTPPAGTAVTDLRPQPYAPPAAPLVPSAALTPGNRSSASRRERAPSSPDTANLR